MARIEDIERRVERIEGEVQIVQRTLDRVKWTVTGGAIVGGVIGGSGWIGDVFRAISQAVGG